MYSACLPGCFGSPKVPVKLCLRQNDFPVPEHMKISLITTKHHCVFIDLNTQMVSLFCSPWRMHYFFFFFFFFFFAEKKEEIFC